MPLVKALGIPHGRRILVLDDWRLAVLLQRHGGVVEMACPSAEAARKACLRGAFAVPYEPTRLPFDDGRFDAAICPTYLPDLVRVLKPGGALGLQAEEVLPDGWRLLVAPPGTTAARLS